MGQYYKIIILSDIKDIKNKKEIIRIWMTPRSYNEGVKLYEHSYLNTNG